MKVRKALPWIFIPLACGALAYSVRSADFQRTWTQWFGSGPILECPATVDVGEQEYGRITTARFTLVNRGGQELVVNDVRTKCVCSGLEQEKEGRFYRVQSLQIAPGESSALVVRISVQGQIGATMHNTILFRTNDPTMPEASMDVIISKVTGPVNTSPTSVMFGTVVVGERVRQSVELRDKAVKPRAIRKVESTRPEQFTVRLLSIENGNGTQRPIKGEFTPLAPGVLVGRMEVELISTKPGPIDGSLLVHLDEPNRPPDKIGVTARVVALVEALPAEVVLPRSSSNGPMYYAKCLCRSNNRKPLTLKAEKVPPGVVLQISPDEDNPSVQIVRIECKTGEDKGLVGGAPRVVSLRAKTGDQETTLEIPVTCKK